VVRSKSPVEVTMKVTTGLPSGEGRPRCGGKDRGGIRANILNEAVIRSGDGVWLKD
jgi:hypothetical protein